MYTYTIKLFNLDTLKFNQQFEHISIDGNQIIKDMTVFDGQYYWEVFYNNTCIGKARLQPKQLLKLVKNEPSFPHIRKQLNAA